MKKIKTQKQFQKNQIKIYIIKLIIEIIVKEKKVIILITKIINKVVISIIKTINKIHKPKFYNKMINNPIHSRYQKKFSKKEL